MRFFNTNTNLAVTFTNYTFEKTTDPDHSPSDAGSTHSDSIPGPTDTKLHAIYTTPNAAHNHENWPTNGYKISLDVATAGSDINYRTRLLRTNSARTTTRSILPMFEFETGTGIKTTEPMTWGAVNVSEFRDSTDLLGYDVAVSNTHMMNPSDFAIRYSDSDSWVENDNFEAPVPDPFDLTEAALLKHGRGGPFTIGGDLYAFAPLDSDRSVVGMLKSTNGGTSWLTVDDNFLLSSACVALAGIVDGDDIHVAYQQAGTGSRIGYSRFDTSTDTWSVVNTQIATSGVDTVTSGDEVVTIDVDGSNIVVGASYVDFSVGQGTTFYHSNNSGSSWTQREPYADIRVGACPIGDSGTTHFLAKTLNSVASQTWNSYGAGTNDSYNDIESFGANTNAVHMGQWLKFSDSGVFLAVPYVGPSTNEKARVVHWQSIQDNPPSVSYTVVPDVSDNDVDIISGTPQVALLRNSTGDWFLIYVSSGTVRWVSGSFGTWNDDTTSGITGANQMSVQLVDDSTVGILYDDGSGVVYDEFEVSAGEATPGGSGNVSGVGNLDGVGATTKSGSGSITGIGLTAGDGLTQKSGSGSIPGVGAVVGDGSIVTSGSGSISSIGSLEGAGQVSTSGSGDVSGIGLATGDGLTPGLTPKGSGTVSGVGAVTGAGATSKVGSGSVSGIALIEAQGATQHSGSGSLVGVGSLLGDGLADHSGSGSIVGAGALVSQGHTDMAGSGQLVGVGSLIGDGLTAVLDPAGLNVIIDGTTAQLTWDASETPGVTDYIIFRRTPQTGATFNPEVDESIAVTTNLFYDDEGLDPGSYDWQVFGRIPG